jgi:hypothetical protein
MSRGLGHMQRAILAGLTPAGWSESRGHRFLPAPGVFDLRQVLSENANIHNAYSHCRFVRPAFQVAFSRAVRGLLRRGALRDVSGMVPLAARDRYGAQARYHALADGDYFVTRTKQTRFVMLGTARSNRGAGGNLRVFLASPWKPRWPTKEVTATVDPKVRHCIASTESI